MPDRNFEPEINSTLNDLHYEKIAYSFYHGLGRGLDGYCGVGASGVGAACASGSAAHA